MDDVACEFACAVTMRSSNGREVSAILDNTSNELFWNEEVDGTLPESQSPCAK